MSTCKVCNKAHSRFLMNNRLVCLACDELTFDIEIEVEELEAPASKQSPSKERRPTQKRAKPSLK
jgi:hypothetical protein